MNREGFHKLWEEINRLDEEIISGLVSAKVYNHDKEGYFPYVPMYHEERLFNVFSNINKITEKVSPTFLDVGAGTGRIVRIAKELGLPAFGVEFYQPYVNAGRKYHSLTENELICADAFTLSREFLGNVNIIYTYMPISDTTIMSELHFHLFKNSLSHTVFVEMLPSYYPMNHFLKEFSYLNDDIEFGNIAAVRK